MNSTLKAWIFALRPRTLPLSLSVIFLGAGLAAVDEAFSLPIFLLILITAVLLQALSDLANDYGDAKNNLDGKDRVGPTRAVSSGQISAKHMLAGIYLMIILIISSSLLLFSQSFGTNLKQWFSFIVLACSAIWAAICYTMGKNPYGYKAMGDYFVFIYFGLVAVLASYYLFTHSLVNAPIFPAIAAGLFATSVLNINNIRDMEGDRKNGKITQAIKFGPIGSRVYQLCLVFGGILAWVAHLFINYSIWTVAILTLTLPIVFSAYKVFITFDAKILNKQLKITALSIAAFHTVMAIILPSLA